MSDESLAALRWVLIAVGVSPIVLAICWTVVDGIVRPLLIPSAEIERLANEVMTSHPDDPLQAAFIEEYAAWTRSEGLEQGKWNRVRKAIVRKLAQHEA